MGEIGKWMCALDDSSNTKPYYEPGNYDISETSVTKTGLGYQGERTRFKS